MLNKRPHYPLWLAGISLMIFVPLLVGVVTQAKWIQAIDTPLVAWITSWRPHWLTQFLLVITALGEPVSVMILGAILIALLLFLKQKRYAVFTLLVIGGMSGVNHVIKSLVHRPRPFIADPSITPLAHAGGYSFPSGHSSGTMLLYGTVIIILWALAAPRWAKYWGSALSGLMILLTGYSRIYVQVHYPTDVLAGYSSALVGLMLCWWLLYPWLRSITTPASTKTQKS